MQAPGQVQQGSGEGSEGSREGLGFFAETGQVQQGSGNPEKVPGSPGAKPSQVQRVPEKVAEKVPEKVLGIFGAGPDQFNRVSEKVSEKVWEALVQSQVTCNRVPEKVPLWCRARSGSNRFKGFPALGFAACFRKICKNKTLRLLGIPPKLIFMNSSFLALLN